MSRRSQSFTITGSTSIEVADSGIQSVQGEPAKMLVEIRISVSAWNGAEVKAYEGQTQKQGALDTFFRGYAAIASMTDANGELMAGFAVDRELTIGDPYKVAVGPAGTATSIRGVYIYDQAD